MVHVNIRQSVVETVDGGEQVNDDDDACCRRRQSEKRRENPGKEVVPDSQILRFSDSQILEGACGS